MRFATYLEDILVFSKLAEGVFTPAGGVATLATEIGSSLGQAGWADVRILVEVYSLVQPKNGQIIEQCSRVKFWMYEKVYDVSFDVRVKFDIVINVPFAESYSEIVVRIAAKTKNTLIHHESLRRAYRENLLFSRKISQYLRFNAVSGGDDVQTVD